MTATPAWLAAIEALLNRGIQSSAQATTTARRLNATALRVRIQGLATVRASVLGGRLALVASDEPADATLVGSPLALANLARGTDRGIASSSAQVQGDAEIANLYRQLFTLSRPDMEEELSHIMGDLPARRLSQLARQAVGWGRKVRRAAGENVAEYLQEESRDLVSKPELDEFLHGVDQLREIADRVEARLARLEQRRKGSV
jgi:ubiquinone biosynthesis accessory factor UbiJ